MAKRTGAVVSGSGKLHAEGMGVGRKQEALEALANAELRAHCFALENARLFTEAGLQRKIRSDARRSQEICVDDIPSEILDYLFDQWIASQLSGCRLTRLQRVVYELHLRGLSIMEIANQTGQSRRHVPTTLRIAREQARKRQPDKYDGLQEVYWQEVRRHIYRKPRHGWNK
jgi:hypothetical protein